MIRLYDYWRSSASYRVRIALDLAGLTWETTSIDLTAGSQTDADHISLNPQGLVPVLEIDGVRLTQSLAIIEYLNERFQLGLLPVPAASRAKVRAQAYAVAMDIHPVCNLKVLNFAAEASDNAISKEAWTRHFIGEGLAALEQMLDEGHFCFGDTVTLADICLVPQVYNARRWGVDLTSMPRIRRIADALEQIPAFARAHPDHHRH